MKITKKYLQKIINEEIDDISKAGGILSEDPSETSDAHQDNWDKADQLDLQIKELEGKISKERDPTKKTELKAKLDKLKKEWDQRTSPGDSDG